MKKLLILGGSICMLNPLMAQWVGTNPLTTQSSVGIGITTPAKKLDISTTTAGDGIRITQAATNGGACALHLNNASTNGHLWSLYSLGSTDGWNGPGGFAIQDATGDASNPRLFISSTGKVDIGANFNIFPGPYVPLNKLNVNTSVADDGIGIFQNGSGACALHLTNNNTANAHWAFLATGNGSSQGSGNFSLYQYGVSGPDRLFINGSTGNVGIGNITPACKLDVTGEVRASGVRATNNVEIGGGTSNPLIPLNIDQTGTQMDGIRFVASSGGRTAYELVQQASPSYSRFKTFGDGRTYIGQFSSPSYDPSSSMLTIGQGSGSNKALNIMNNSNPASPYDIMNIYGDGKTFIGQNVNPVNISSPGMLTVGQATGGSKILNLVNTSNPSSPYDVVNVYGDGKTEIKTDNTIPFSINNAGGSIYGFKFKQSGGNNGMWAYNSVMAYAIGVDNTGTGHIWSDINAAQPINMLNFSYDGTNPQVWIGRKQIAPSAHTNFRLAVDGKLVASSCFITDANWADYVFNDDYQVPDLYDVESYYKANHHLPEIPSEAEVKERGIDVGQMNTLLLKKIEEMTIIMVKQQKEIDALKEKVK